MRRMLGQKLGVWSTRHDAVRHDGQLVTHGTVSRRVSVARRQRRDSGPWRMDLQVSRRLSRRPVVPSLFRPTEFGRIV